MVASLVRCVACSKCAQVLDDFWCKCVDVVVSRSRSPDEEFYTCCQGRCDSRIRLTNPRMLSAGYAFTFHMRQEPFFSAAEQICASKIEGSCAFAVFAALVVASSFSRFAEHNSRWEAGGRDDLQFPSRAEVGQLCYVNAAGCDSVVLIIHKPSQWS